MTTPAHVTVQPAGTPSSPPTHWLRRLCNRLGGWCDYLLDAHHSRIPF